VMGEVCVRRGKIEYGHKISWVSALRPFNKVQTFFLDDDTNMKHEA
jgi:hypothetical protein